MKVLIIEDDRLISLMLSKMVQKMGHEVVAVHATGENAIKSVGDLPIDLILMDIMLEGDIDGIQAMEAIQRNHKVPVIYITGNSDESTKTRASSTNYVAYLIKPVNFSQLQSIIESL